jgi:hypothetical protein
MDSQKKSFIMNTLRRGTYRWYGRWQALNNAKIGRNEYFCQIETCGVIGPKRDFQLDHKLPVVITSGWDSWENVLDRMFCDADGYQNICKACHAIKTAEENRLRPRPPKKVKIKKKKN